MRDFSTNKFKEICTKLVNSGYKSMTLAEFMGKKGKKSSLTVLLRHDVDRFPSMSLNIARIEAEFGLCATYYFRIPYTFNKKIIKKIYNLGHEIGFHYENLSKAKGDFNLAVKSFNEDINKLNKIVPIKTISMHGSPASRFNNIEILQYINLDKYGLLGDANTIDLLQNSW